METPFCVAVVDDDASVRRALCRLLRVAGYAAAGFASGEEFLDALAARAPDCVLLDIHMPGLSGLDVQKKLLDSGARLPVVFITASEGATLGQAAPGTDAPRLLRKPVAAEVLLDAVGAAIANAAADCGQGNGDRRAEP